MLSDFVAGAFTGILTMAIVFPWAIKLYDWYLDKVLGGKQ